MSVWLVIVFFIVVAPLVVMAIVGVVSLVTRKATHTPMRTPYPSELAELREEVAQLRAEVERLRRGWSTAGSTDIKLPVDKK